MGFFFEIVFEFLLQLFGDVILDGLLRSRSPVANTIGNSIVASLAALILAGISLAVFPQHLIASQDSRVAALVILPIVNGLLMSVIGRRYIRLGRPRSGYEHFFPAFVFSLTFGAIRLLGAR